MFFIIYLQPDDGVIAEATVGNDTITEDTKEDVEGTHLLCCLLFRFEWSSSF